MGKGYTRFSAAMRQTEGEDSDGVSHKLLKKVKKLSSVGKTDQSSSSKRVKLPKKFFDDCHTVNQAPIPKKLRSAITRHYDSISGLPNPKDGIRRLEKPLEDDSTKVEFNKDERQQSTISESISEQIPIDEEEAIASLLLLSKNNNTNEINLKTETSNSEGLVKNDMVIEYLNKSTNTVDAKKDCNDFRDGKVSQKICSRHVYICQMIKQLQDMEGKTVISHKEEKTNKIKDSVTKESTTMTLFQDHWHGCGVEARDSSVAQNQVPVSPYFGSPLYDPSQWGKPPKHQMWMKSFMSGGCYQNLQKSGHDVMPHHSSPNNIQPPSLLNVLGSKENGGLFLVDSSPTLNLMCNEHLGRDRSWLSDL